MHETYGTVCIRLCSHPTHRCWQATKLSAKAVEASCKSAQTTPGSHTPTAPLPAGIVAVVRSHPLEPQPYTGMTSIVTGEIAEDLTNYLAESEQVGGGDWVLGSGCWMLGAALLLGKLLYSGAQGEAGAHILVTSMAGPLGLLCCACTLAWTPLVPPWPQVNSAVALGVSINRDCTVKSAGGFMVQVGAGARARCQCGACCRCMLPHQPGCGQSD